MNRKAKTIKKEEGLSHYQALDKAAQDTGFSNWQHFLNISTKSGTRELVLKIPKFLVTSLPRPRLLTYYSLTERNGAKRPNAKMPIESHSVLGGLLREARKATEYNKRAQTAVGFVQKKLDDWVQNEYPDRNELSDEVFFQMYYGNHDSQSDPSPTLERKLELVNIFQQASEILERMYFDCAPVRELHKKLTLAVKVVDNWPFNKNLKDFTIDKRTVV
ncbi:MAG: DUF5623 domain-containing protein [Daejeonella sp.]